MFPLCNWRRNVVTAIWNHCLSQILYNCVISFLINNYFNLTKAIFRICSIFVSRLVIHNKYKTAILWPFLAYMTNIGDARTKLSIINCLLYNICAAKELTCLWTYFRSAVERVNKMWDLHSLLVGMLPYDSLKWIKSVQIFHLSWHVYRNHGF